MPGPRRSVPNGSTQRFTWSTQWLHLSQRLLSTFFKETTSVLLPSDSVFSWWMSFTTRGPILNPTKTENEFPSKGKPQIPEKTSQQWRLKTYRDHTRTESFMKTSTEDFDNFLMTSTGHSDASVCERLSSCAPGATATLDLGRPTQVLLSKRPKKSRNKNRMQ